ncbi:DNA-directed RNA polymerase subunit beta [Geobacillus sp. FSL K6-0789]|uniref:DNA-directed RNA polymerase subunit beta n=1 Tax=Geobacillus stearothermophilus TaxID=1422 RepID=A0A3L7C2N0_GEOSE|nr:DNA-directed RNA polymerase subunit beta [Geobacillus stearothermophilus]MBR2515777.1 DNA-directed RNA polymerase subunit beta [Geobacillus sp.]RLP99089.1 DNA-directed RNA polymerase subunit beta [Geobacillus stearothermophilus]RLQ07041.1 DNA-directed RNA polymerase subunit beta [Geobacillus stearothermophilus]RLQ08452.1 DNA-directed RNA polymerase subunit beta [Geobacillus stearothermophilus]RLQ13486.1 DNA-directed RNA polymerase subunit beta [Geobacillus stearothermophilus]
MSDERHQERMHRPSSRMARRKGRVRKSPPAPAEPEAQALPAEEEAAAPRRFARTRLIIVAALMALSLAAGAVVGYSAIGDGAWLDVFRPSTWQHILDFVEKGT